MKGTWTMLHGCWWMNLSCILVTVLTQQSLRFTENGMKKTKCLMSGSIEQEDASANQSMSRAGWDDRKATMAQITSVRTWVNITTPCATAVS